MRRVLIVLIIPFIIVLCTTILYFLQNPYVKIRKAEPEVAVFYLSCYDALMGQNRFDSLLKRLIVENMDLKSMGVAVNYVIDHKHCKFIPDIEAKCAYLKSFPADTTWRAQITETYARVWNMKEAVFGYSMCSRLDELKKNCNNSNQ